MLHPKRASWHQPRTCQAKTDIADITDISDKSHNMLPIPNVQDSNRVLSSTSSLTWLKDLETPSGRSLAQEFQSRDPNAICFLVVLNEMLGIGHDLLRLYAFDNRLHKLVAKVGVFPRKVLKVPAVPWQVTGSSGKAWQQQSQDAPDLQPDSSKFQRHPCHIQSGPKLDVRTLVVKLFAHALSPLLRRSGAHYSE